MKNGCKVRLNESHKNRFLHLKELREKLTNRVEFLVTVFCEQFRGNRFKSDSEPYAHFSNSRKTFFFMRKKTKIMLLT